jgi:hypothetical protein
MRLLLGILALAATGAQAAPKATTTVTTYVTTVQDERESTRWTLTKWLEIKERMKMMDLWLALFSDPKKDKFEPELMLSYGITRGTMGVTDQTGKQTADLAGNSGHAQLWLTNLVSSTIGIRMLNIDLGAEGYQHETGAFAPAAVDASGSVADAGATRSVRTRYYTGDVRIFGKNVQDSSIVFKYGRYDTKNTIAAVERHGVAAGAELQLYFFRWLGAEGNYMVYGDSHGYKGSDATQHGSYYDYQGYIEISLLRFSAGPYREDWTTATPAGDVLSTEKGYVGNVKLSF